MSFKGLFRSKKKSEPGAICRGCAKAVIPETPKSLSYGAALRAVSLDWAIKGKKKPGTEECTWLKLDRYCLCRCS